MTPDEEFGQVAGMLQGTVTEALVHLSQKYGETPLEAAAHLRAVIDGVLSEDVEYASLYDRALVCPPLMRDLRAVDRGHSEVAVRWGVAESSVRRARNQIRAESVNMRNPLL